MMIEAFLQIREIHKVFQAATEVLEDDIKIATCIPNCGLCCEHNVPNILTIEAIHAISVLTGQGKLKKAVSIAEGWLLDHHPSAALYERMPQGFASDKLRAEWQAITRSQCPFLNTQSKECLLHDVRPFSCRAYGITRDCAAICPRPLGRGESLTQRRYIPADKLREYIEQCKTEWRDKNKAWIISGAFPTVLYRAAEPEKFKGLVLDNKIASAKLVGIEYDASLMWQPQLDMLRMGKSPDLVAAIT